MPHSMFARFFDNENARNYSEYREFNLMFIRQMQNYTNDLLQAQGFILLNTLYDALGLDPSSAGCVVGWTLEKTGDGYVMIEIIENDDKLLLDFNVDGVIKDEIDKIVKKRKNNASR